MIFAVAMTVHLSGTEVLATENNGNWRPTYDLIMKWVNFGILVFVLVKFAGGPIKEFLEGRKEELALEIKKVESDKDKVLEKIKEAMQTLDESHVRFEKLKERILEQGEREKQKIIESAHQQSQIMLESAKRKIDSRIQQARKTIRMEMVDVAIALASEKIPEKITEEDSNKFIDAFLTAAASE
jgi:F-type H+-transporting ATPase subunit b